MANNKKTKKHTTRPLHKRIALHPVSVMVLLCAGVLIAGSTVYARAVSYDVTATIPAPTLTDPAVINQPADQIHVSGPAVTVSGICPAGSYVNLYRNSTFSGTGICTAGEFHIQTSLTPGANQLFAQDYNITDQPGPVSSAITVYYDPPPQHLPEPPAVSPAVVLEVSSLDLNDYSSGDISQVSTQPTVSGYAPPFSDITVTFHSDVVECKTKADGNGFWICTLPSELPPGLHTVDVVAITPRGTRLVFKPFNIKVVLGLVSLFKKANPDLLAISGDYRYRLWQVDRLSSFNINLAGGTGPFKVVIDWGDGQTSQSFETEKSFAISHTYSSTGNYVVLVKITDAKKTTAILQLSAVVGGTPLPAIVGSTQGPWSSLLDSLRSWLWLAWPMYIAVVLMVISFWIGEREAYHRVLVAERLPGGRPNNRRGKMKS